MVGFKGKPEGTPLFLLISVSVSQNGIRIYGQATKGHFLGTAIPRNSQLFSGTFSKFLFAWRSPSTKMVVPKQGLPLALGVTEQLREGGGGFTRSCQMQAQGCRVRLRHWGGVFLRHPLFASRDARGVLLTARVSCPSDAGSCIIWAHARRKRHSNRW